MVLEKKGTVVFGTEYRPYGTVEKVSTFLKEKYDRHNEQYWDQFYRSNKNNFFKDRHWLMREFPDLSTGSSTVLEVGCGVGNSLFPLLQQNPDLRFWSFDISSVALDVLRANPEFDSQRTVLFHWDPSTQPIPSEILSPNSFDYCLIVFVMSSIAPEMMANVFRHLHFLLKEGGSILMRDYAVGDMAQVRFERKKEKKKIQENFYVRKDGTRSYFFSTEFVEDLCRQTGFVPEQNTIVTKDVENQKLNLQMKRAFIQTKLVKNSSLLSSLSSVSSSSSSSSSSS